MEIRRINKGDLVAVVKVHKDSFNGFFLTGLGDHFLKVYYDCVRKDEKAVLLGAFQDKQLMGFCAAATFAKGFNSRLLKRNALQFFFIALRLALIRVSALIRLLKNFSKTDSKVKDEGNYAELLSIGVSNKSQGQGIGKKLLLDLEKELKVKDISRLSLTTDYENNQRTISFYKGLGYEVYYEFIAYPNRKMYRLIKRLD